MCQRLYCFLVVLVLMFSGSAFSQQKDTIAPKSGWILPVFNQTAAIRLTTISPDFYARQLGFFCKKEIQLEKITAVPFRFRLGSMEYTNYLEQKPNARKPLN